MIQDLNQRLVDQRPSSNSFSSIPLVLYMFYFGVRYFPKNIFPTGTSQVATYQMCNFPSGNFPKVRLGSLRRRRLQWGPSAAARTIFGRELRLGQTWEVVAWEITNLESCHAWENTLEKFPLGENPLGKYL